MAIPAPLAFPPTALRNVAAGLVVGNPVGSSGTRGKALTSAELKSIVEASGISYLPLAGGILTGPITGTGGLIEQRDGLNAQQYNLFETYTSGTNYGSLCLKANSAGHQIGSARGTSGSNRQVSLGQFDSAGAFTPVLRVSTTNLAFLDTRTGDWWAFGNYYFRVGGGLEAQVAADVGINWSGTTDCRGTKDIGLRRNAAGVLEVNSSVSGTLRDLLMRDITLTPSSSRTLGANGQFSIEMTSNTAGNLVYRGSDGTTRRMALTFS